MSKPDSTKKTPPRAARHFGHIESASTPGTFKLFNERDEPGRKRKLREAGFMAFSSKGNCPKWNVHVVEWNAGFGKPTALLPCDCVADAHPFRLAFKRLKDLLMFCILYPRLAWCGVRPNAKALTGINAREPRLYCLVHNDAQKLYLVNCRVLRYCVASSVGLPGLPPLDKVAGVPACQLARDVNLHSVEKCFDIAPSDTVPLKRARRVRVTLVEKPVNPSAPHLGGNETIGLGRGHVSAQFVGLPFFGDDRPPEFRAFLADDTGEVTIFQPVKGATLAFVETGQCRPL